MNSMTGYGRAVAALGTHTLTVQVTAVNRKTLDLTVRLPEAWDSLEPMIGGQVRRVAARGKVHVELELTGIAGTEASWDEAAASEAVDRLAAFAKKEGVDFHPTPELLWQIASAQRKGPETPAADAARPAIERALGEALRGFAAMRAREGEALLVDFLTRLGLLAHQVATVAERAPQVPALHREQLLRRLREAGLDLEPDDERVLKELALFADRCDITEELTRLRSHLDQFGVLLRSGGEIGRKAEFILQEIGREVHTIGSKANDLVISRAVIELKNEVERVREQIANVE